MEGFVLISTYILRTWWPRTLAGREKALLAGAPGAWCLGETSEGGHEPVPQDEVRGVSCGELRQPGAVPSNRGTSSGK